MRFQLLPGLFPGRSPADPARVAEIKQLVLYTLGLDASAGVSIQQLACREAGCPPVETVIAVFESGQAGRKWTLHAPLADITDTALRAALRARDDVDHHAAALQVTTNEGEPK